MRRGLLATALCVVAVGVGQAEAADPSGIRGSVVDSTCYGPCIYPPPPPPLYAGKGLTVTVHRVSTGRLVAVRRPEDGTIRVRTRRGLFRVRAEVDGKCWTGETKDVRVRRGRFTRVRLAVQNVCIV